MKLGVVYKFKPFNKINGTLFYCFEYYQFIKKYKPVNFYIVDISQEDLELVKKLFLQKYNVTEVSIIPISRIELFKLHLDKTVIFDVLTFYDVKEFLTGEVLCYSNDGHNNFRYKNSRAVTYYGSYPYQNYDVFSYLKLNFEIFKSIDFNGRGVFVSALNQNYIAQRLEEYKSRFDMPVILKKSYTGSGNIFETISHVHYVHTSRDTNNRIIPEAFFYKKTVSIDNYPYSDVDSIHYRYTDIRENGLSNYTLTESDEIIKQCLKS
jgi:hypothetical protein